MRQNFNTVMSWIGLSEGGYVNHPKDPGGATDRGITQATFDAWNKRQGYPKRPVRGISKETAEKILAMQYFTPVRFDDLPSGLDYAVVDYAVNSGPARATKELQRLVGVAQDGVLGERTLAAVMEQDLVGLIIRYCNARLDFMRRLKTWKTFRNGWTARVMGKTLGVQHDDIGVIDRAVRLARGEKLIPAPTIVAPSRAQETPGGLAAFFVFLLQLLKGRKK